MNMHEGPGNLANSASEIDLRLYRGHWLHVLHRGERWVWEATEYGSLALLPTSVSADLEEGPEVCLNRGRTLVDQYCRVQPKTAHHSMHGSK